MGDTDYTKLLFPCLCALFKKSSVMVSLVEPAG